MAEQEREIDNIELGEQLRDCPACGYTDGFHNMFRRQKDTIKWYLICPQCSSIFDAGLTVTG